MVVAVAENSQLGEIVPVVDIDLVKGGLMEDGFMNPDGIVVCRL